METLEIEKLVYGGDAMARCANGEVVFVQGALPGETVKAAIVPRKKGAAKARLMEVTTPSEHRVTAPCSVFGTCGGCDWQHLAYEEQLRWKTQIVSESLARLGKFPNPPVQPAISATQWQYRNKVQWVIVRGPQPKLGYLAEESHNGILFETCHIIPEAFHSLKSWLEKHPADLIRLAKVQIQGNPEGQWLISLTANNPADPNVAELAINLTEQFPQIVGVLSVAEDQPPKVLAGENELVQSAGGKSYLTSGSSFFQVNPAMSEKLLGYLDEIMPEEIVSFLDVYCGVGLFALHLAGRCEQATGIEYSRSAVALANENARRQYVAQTEFIAGDAGLTLPGLELKFDVAIVDPPRKGCDKAVLDALTEKVTEQLVYVSCNPSTLARDLRILVDGGWRLGSVQPFDMFPQTYHVESIATLFKD